MYTMICRCNGCKHIFFKTISSNKDIEMFSMHCPKCTSYIVHLGTIGFMQIFKTLMNLGGREHEPKQAFY